MGFEQIVFWGLFCIAVLSGLLMITARNAVHSVLYMVVTFLATGGTWLLLQAEFLAIALILVYVGAVMVLFLFVIMLLDIDKSIPQQKFVRYLPIALTVATILLLLLILFTLKLDTGETVVIPESYNNLSELGTVLYTEYLLAFEIAGVILLLAIVAAISLTFRGSQTNKQQNVSRQLMANKANRLKLSD